MNRRAVVLCYRGVLPQDLLRGSVVFVRRSLIVLEGVMSTFAAAFYNSTAWRSARSNYMKKAGGLCERCLKKGLITPAEIVHHKVRLTPENITDTKITLAFDNLEALCRQCHEDEHAEGNLYGRQMASKKRYTVDKKGHVTAKQDA